MALTIDKIKNINIPINVSRKPDNYPPSTRGISLYNDSVNLYDAISLFMASAPPATFNIGEGLLGNGSVLSPLSWAGVNHTAALSGNGSVGSPLDVADKGITLSKLAQSGATLNQIIKWDGTNWVPSNETGGATSFVPLSRELTINGVTYDLSQNRSWTINSMVYPESGIPVSTGSAWGTSIVNNSTNWNTAYSWGNHALAGYLTSYTETDPTVPSHVKAITTTNISNWNSAYGWGNHAIQGYLTSVNLNALTDVTIGTLNNGQILQYNGTTSQWENVSVTIGSGDMQKSVYDIDNDGVVDYSETISVTVRNTSNTDILRRGTIVYLSGSTGNRPNAFKAQANSESTSSGTFGVVVNDIDTNGDGLVAAMGTLHNLDTRTGANGNPNPFTSDTLLDGDILWLDPTTAGYVTKTKPSAPNHAVFIGIVAATSPTNGRIVYKIQNGYEVEELHNVKITAPLLNNQVLRYNNSNSLWENKTLNFQVPLTLNTTPSSGAATLAGDGTLTIPNYTLSGLGGVPTTRTLTINGTSYDLSADRSWTVSTASALDDLTDVVVSSPTSGQVLSYDGTNWVNTTGGGGGGTPGGSTTQVQFNDAGSFGGAAGFTYDKTAFTNTGRLNIGSPSSPTGRLNIKGGGNDSTTVNTRLTNSADTELLKVLDNGNTNIGTGFNWDNANGRLGIGTSTPGTSIETTGAIRLSGTGTQPLEAPNATLFPVRCISGSIALRSSSGGGVSVSSSDLTPSARLHVRGSDDLSTSSAFLVQNNATTSLTLLDIRNNGDFSLGANFVFDRANNRLNIGNLASPAATLNVKGAGSTLASGNAANITNSDSKSILRTRNDAVVLFGNSSSIQWFPIADAGGGSVNIDGTNLSLYSGTTNQAASWGRLHIGGEVHTQTSGDVVHMYLFDRFSPTSGTATTSTLRVNTQINQTGGANGITRGIYLTPSLTSAADWRSIEWSNNSGFGLYGVGTANNYLAGNLGLGTTAPTKTLHVAGTTRIDGTNVIADNRDNAFLTQSASTTTSNRESVWGNGGYAKLRAHTKGFYIGGSFPADSYLLYVDGGTGGGALDRAGIYLRPTQPEAGGNTNGGDVIIELPAGTGTGRRGAVLIGTATATGPSAIVEISSTNQGLLLPRMTGAQAEAIPTPADGLLVYANNGNGAVITSVGFWGYSAGAWSKLN